MEGKSALESRHKRTLQSDAESKKKRHKGGGQPCYDTDIKMETVIYKLDSRNKLVLPPADNTNTDEGFLKYVKNRVEQSDDFKDTLPDDYKRDKKRETDKKRHKRHKRDSDTSAEERPSRRTWCNCRKNKTRKNSPRKRRHSTDDENNSGGMTYIYEKRPEKYERNVQFCSCRRPAYTDTAPAMSSANTPRNSRYSADIQPYNENEVNVQEQTICDTEDQEQMLKCLQTVLNKLCTLSNVGGAKLEIAVEPTIENGHQQQNTNTQVTAYQQNNNNNQAQGNVNGNYAGQVDEGSYARQRNAGNYAEQTGGHYAGITPHQYTEPHIDPRLRNPENVFYPSKWEEDRSSGFSQPVETRVLGKQFDVNGEQIPNELVYDNVEINNDETNQQYYQQQPAQHYDSIVVEKPYPTEYNTLRPALMYMPDGAVPQTPLRLSQDMSSSIEQQYGLQSPPQISMIRGNEDVRSFNQQNAPRASYVSTTPERPSVMVATHRYSLANTAPERQSGDATATRYSNDAQEYSLRASYPSRLGTRLPTILLRRPKPIRSTPENDAQFLRVPKPTQAQNAAQHAAHIGTFLTKNGLQNYAADNCNVIPNVRVVDYNNQGYCCGVQAQTACPRALPTAQLGSTPNQNESYEYILMRVKKGKPMC